MKEKELEKILKALANQRRLRIVRFLKSKGEASVGRISEELKLSFKATSKHLSLLIAADILEKEQRSLSMIFSLSPTIPDVARKILTFL